MKFTATIVAAALAFTGSVSAATCTPGLDYCTDVLQDVDGANKDAIRQELRNKGEVFLSNAPGVWSGLLFHCNNDHSISLADKCAGGCINAGAGKSDICNHDASDWL
ncbi:hypothetical protein P170DRAFT_479944 [Aspergillus steynii IBT 23096]|uniref:Uncharacterized protein n=1 Tax=Aspergillus steynii IBT 23096 TaxID=1392250 RepID=A0A2I2FUA8_9EURO|nr:uncharacterized protein P170DRAFT_479944 [Aspergillus steynii IBT 23096]PLB44177.1 hypothetical protein P170DRAFT_479944 [Aspergillus steynii IBT 23096]